MEGKKEAKSDTKKFKAAFYIDQEKWEQFSRTAKLNESDASKELRKFITKYLSEHKEQ